MSEFKCSELELDYAVQQDKCKPVIIGVSEEIYPIFWIGEKTYPTHYGWGRLVLIRFADGSKRTFVNRVSIVFKDFEDTIPAYRIQGKEVIFIGGVYPRLVKVENILWTVREEIEHLLDTVKKELENVASNLTLLVPSGIGYKTNAILGEKVEPKMKKIEDAEFEVYDPPEVHWIIIKNGELIDVKSLWKPRNDC